MNLEILEQNKPVITTNFDLVKAELINNLKEYENLVVTEESLSVCKTARGYLATLAINIDKKRKEVKQEFSTPIIEFENKCKELMSLVNNVKGKIDEGIKVFDDKTKEEKKRFAIQAIEQIAKELELRDNYANQIQLQDRYMNLTITQKEVREDIKSQALALKNSQFEEDLRYKAAESACDLLNETLNLVNKVNVTDFKTIIECTDSEPEVVAEIVKKEALKRKEIEEKAIQQEKERLEKLAQEELERKANEEHEVEMKLSNIVEKSLLEEEPFFTATLEIKATKEGMNKLKDFMDNNKIEYRKV